MKQNSRPHQLIKFSLFVRVCLTCASLHMLKQLCLTCASLHMLKQLTVITFSWKTTIIYLKVLYLILNVQIPIQNLYFKLLNIICT